MCLFLYTPWIDDPACISFNFPDNKVNGANMEPTWVLSAPDGPHVGPMNLAIKVTIQGEYLATMEESGSGVGWQRWVSLALACVSRFMSGSSNSIPAYLFDLKTQFGVSQQAGKCRFNQSDIFINTLKSRDTHIQLTRPWVHSLTWRLCGVNPLP